MSNELLVFKAGQQTKGSKIEMGKSVVKSGALLPSGLHTCTIQTGDDGEVVVEKAVLKSGKNKGSHLYLIAVAVTVQFQNKANVIKKCSVVVSDEETLQEAINSNVDSLMFVQSNWKEGRCYCSLVDKLSGTLIYESLLEAQEADLEENTTDNGGSVIEIDPNAPKAEEKVEVKN